MAMGWPVVAACAHELCVWLYAYGNEYTQTTVQGGCKKWNFVDGKEYTEFYGKKMIKNFKAQSIGQIL